MSPILTTGGGVYPAAAGGASPWLLDQITPQPTAAFSTRKIKSTATNSVRLCDVSGANTTPIGFDSGTSDLDVSAVNNYYTTVGALNCANVNGWYDQSGNGRDFLGTNSVVLKWNTVDSGTLQTINSNPALYFDNNHGRDKLVSSMHLSDVATSTALTVISSVRAKVLFDWGVGTNAPAGMLTDSGSGYGSFNYLSHSTASGDFASAHIYNSGDKTAKKTGIAINTNYVLVSRLTSGTLQIYVNGGTPGTISAASIDDMNYQTLTLGTGTTTDCLMLEMLVYNTALSNADINTLCSASGVTNGNIASRAGVTWTSI